MNNLAGINYIERPPKNITSTTKLIVLVHGYGSNETDLFSFVSDLPQEAYIVSVQGIYTTPFGGYAWYAIQLDDMEKYIDFEQAKNAVNQLSSFIQQFVTLHQLSSSVRLCGFSQGCILGYALLMNHPKLIKKFAGLSGYFEPKIATLNPKIITEKPQILLTHGTADPIIPITWARQSSEYLKKHSIEHQYQEYATGHGLNQENYEAVMTFLRE